MTPEKRGFRFVHAATLAKLNGAGRSNDAISEFVWGHRFCVVTRDEWICEPISRSQEFHVAYLLNMLDSMIGKIGLSTIMSQVREPK